MCEVGIHTVRVKDCSMSQDKHSFLFSLVDYFAYFKVTFISSRDY